MFKPGDLVGSYKNEGHRYRVLYAHGGVTGLRLVSSFGVQHPPEGQFQYEAATAHLYAAPEDWRTPLRHALGRAVAFGAQLSRDVSEEGDTCDLFEHNLLNRAAMRVLALEAMLEG